MNQPIITAGNVPGRGVAGVVSQFNNPGPQIKGYGCLAHPKQLLKAATDHRETVPLSDCVQVICAKA
jgi:hypothetical protein